MTIRKEPRFNKDFKSSPGEKVAYHAPCHLRAQAKGFKGRDMLKQIPGVKPVLAMECCGHDGTYAMKVEGFEPSQRIGKKASMRWAKRPPKSGQQTAHWRHYNLNNMRVSNQCTQ